VTGDYEPIPTVPPPTHPPAGWVEPPRPSAEAAAVQELTAASAPPTELRLKIELAVVFFLSAVPGLVLGLRGFTDPESVDTDIAVLDLIAAILAALGPAAVAVYLLWRDGRLSVAGFDRRPARFIAGYGAVGFVCAVIALLCVAIVAFTVLTAVGAEPDEESERLTITIGSVLAGIAIALVAGVGEEIVYRAYAITRFEELGWPRAAVWVPWAVFTVQHLYQGPMAVLAVGAVAGVFVWLYRWQRSVWPVVVAHVLYDLFVLFVLATAG
jgi:membrane protease YdiL (CAAX protease family)